MPRSADTQVRILHAAYLAFYREGFVRVSMEAVARTAGVTKRTIYHHYDSKDALLAAALSHQSEEARQLIEEWGSGAMGDPADFVSQIFRGLAKWADRPRWLGSGYTRMTMELADLPGHPARRIARDHKKSVEEWLAGEFERLGARDPNGLARQVVLLMEGSMVLALLHGDADYILSAERAAMQLATEPDR